MVRTQKINTYSDSYGFSANVRFTYKCLITKYPGLSVLFTMILSILILAYQLRIFELNYYRAIGQIDFEQYTSAIWVIIITMGTVGFGDLVPYSIFGRLIVIFTSLWGALIITLVVMVLRNLFSLTPN